MNRGQAFSYYSSIIADHIYISLLGTSFLSLSSSSSGHHQHENLFILTVTMPDGPPHSDEDSNEETSLATVPPKLNIVVMVIGSRGDIQPFVAVAKVLRENWGHRVRLATHPAFKEFVEEHGIEFFDVGGDPAELMAFMVKNPVSFPSSEARGYKVCGCECECE